MRLRKNLVQITLIQVQTRTTSQIDSGGMQCDIDVYAIAYLPGSIVQIDRVTI